MELACNIKGQVSELYASIYLIKQGYQVFFNISGKGPIDLVAVKDNETRFIDVKSAYVHFDSKGRLKINNHNPSNKQQSLCVEILYVAPTGECAFSVDELLSELILKPMGFKPSLKALYG